MLCQCRIGHTKPGRYCETTLCFAVAIGNHVNCENSVPCCLRKQTDRALDRQVSQMLQGRVSLYLRSLVERHHKRASDLKLNGTGNLQHMHSVYDNCSFKVYPHKTLYHTCTSPVPACNVKTLDGEGAGARACNRVRV